MLHRHFWQQLAALLALTTILSLTPTNTNTHAQSADVPTFREGLVGEVRRLNPLLANLNPVDRDITSLIFEGLMRTNEYGEPQPLLATEWVVSSDRREYVFRLREDVLWQDGTPFSADDVVYTMSLLRSPDFPGDPELANFWNTVETQKLDEHLVRFRLTQPLSSFLDSLTIGILPEHALRGTTATQIASHPFNLSPIGTGAYQLEALRSADGNRINVVDLRVAPVYRQRPEGESGYAIDRMSFRLYQTFDDALGAMRRSEIDGLMAQDQNQRIPLLDVGAVHTALEPTLGALIFNWADEESPFREQRIRIALQTGLDRTAFVENYLMNYAVRADSPIHPNSWAYTTDLPWPPPDAEATRALLQPVAEEAEIRATQIAADAASAGNGEGEGEGEAPSPPPPPTDAILEFSILVPDVDALRNVAQEMANQWGQYSINVRVEAVDTNTYRERLASGDFDAAIVELSLGQSADPDVYTFWHQGQYPDGKNYGGMNDSRISEALERARRDPFGINRIELYHRFQRDFIERAVAIPLYYPLFTYVTAPQVEGVQLGFIGKPSDRFRNLQDWTLTQ